MKAKRLSKTGLRPCPFCAGVELTMITVPKMKARPEFRLLQCDACGATGPTTENSSEISVRLKWDMRATKV